MEIYMLRYRTALAIFFLNCIVNTKPAVAALVVRGDLLAEKQEIVRQINADPTSLDPISNVGLAESHVIRDLFEGLTNQNEAGSPIPGVANRWTTAGNRIWFFYLRPNAKWSNGDPVTAKDFVYSWRRLVDPVNNSPFAYFATLAGIKNAQKIINNELPIEKLGVEAIDNHTLKVTLEQPAPYFLNLTNHFSFFPVNQKIIARYGQNWVAPTNLVGNGAFMLSERIAGEKIVLQPNRHYWDHKNTILTKVTFVPIKQAARAWQSYFAGDVVETEFLPEHLDSKLLQQIPDEFYLAEQLATYYYVFNTQKPPTNDSRVRRALSVSINREVITNKILADGEKAAYRFIPDIIADFTSERGFYDGYGQKELDEQARVLLHLAGFSSHNPLKLSLVYNNSENNKKVATAIASMWKRKLGAEITLINQQWKTYTESRNAGHFNVLGAARVAEYNEPSSFLNVMTSSNAGNWAKFKNNDYDEMVASAMMEKNSKNRNRFYNRAEKMLLTQSPIAPIYYYSRGYLIKSWLKGYPVNNPESVSYSHTLYVIKH